VSKIPRGGCLVWMLVDSVSRRNAVEPPCIRGATWRACLRLLTSPAFLSSAKACLRPTLHGAGGEDGPRRISADFRFNRGRGFFHPNFIGTGRRSQFLRKALVITGGSAVAATLPSDEPEISPVTFGVFYFRAKWVCGFSPRNLSRVEADE